MNIPKFQPATVISFDEQDRSRLRMVGMVRLDTGEELPFAYARWVEPFAEVDDWPGSPYEGLNLRGGLVLAHTMFSWPFPGAKIIVHIEDGQVKFWSWSHLFEAVAIDLPTQ